MTENAIEGKTKRISAGPRPGTVLLETKDELTGGDAAKKATIAGIAKHKTTQTANVFALLNKNGIETSFIERTDETTMVCHDCDMIPVELVMRRYAWGSFLKREPSLKADNGVPHRFDEVLCEFFHKHAVVMPPLADAPKQMDEGEARNLYLKDGAWAEGVYTDPYVQRDGDQWHLHSAKLPASPNNRLMTIKGTLSEEESQTIINDLMLPCFKVLENAWASVETQFGAVALADIKIEAGRRVSDGKLIIADVIDNDSWRIWPGADPTKQLDKQNFRDGSPLSEVADKYALVSELTGQFLKS